VQAAGAAPLVGLRESSNVLIRGSRPVATDGVFLRLAGKFTADISLIGNDLTRIGKIADFTDEAGPASLRSTGNIEKK